jgi:large subunit ribosomal protein L9e
MVKILASESINIPAGVTVTVQNRVVVVKGPRGELTKNLRHATLDIRVKNNGTKVVVSRWFGKKPDIACINTCKAAIRNMINGVVKGFRFKLRFAYAHFPINVSCDGQTVEIRNFLGEKRVRRQVIPESIKVYRTDQSKVKDELVLEGNDLELVSQTAAKLHEQCLVKNKDIRMFLDGIYVQTKENIVKDDE